MRPVRPARPALVVAALVAGLLGVPGPASARTAPDVDALQARLSAAAAEAASLSEELERAAALDGGLRLAEQELVRERDRAQARLDARVRQVWITRRPDPLGGWVDGIGSPALRRLAHRGAAAAVQVDRELVEAVSEQSALAQELRQQAEALRTALRARAERALQAQDTARRLLAEAEAQVAAQVAAQVEALAAAQASAAADQAERDALAAQAQQLVAVRAVLDRASAVVTTALTPAQTRRSRRAQEQEAPLVVLVEAAGSGYPTGWAATGEVLRGLASWYGPGFVGSPTASGAPYDPERLTCAHKTLRLGTVVRVSANGRAISCLVNDRGPYVGPRILDLSRAGSRALGFDGVQEVVVEVLAQTSSPSR